MIWHTAETGELHFAELCCLPPSMVQVVAVGAGKKKEDSEEIIKCNVTAGQTVMYSKYSGTEFEVRQLQGHGRKGRL